MMQDNESNLKLMNYLSLEISMLYIQSTVDHGEEELPRPKP